MSVEGNGIDMHERLQKESITTKILSRVGLGYGEGGISVKTQLERGELSNESLDGAIEIVTTDPSVFVPVEADDDGCGDGRATSRIYRFLDKITNKIEIFKRSVPRAKIFGGGLIVASSMWRTVQGQPGGIESLDDDRHTMARILKDKGVKFGAHTADSHTNDTKCGCGAIDSYREITTNAGMFRENIEGTLELLYGDEYDTNKDAVAHVFDLYSSLNESYYKDETGTKTMAFIESQQAVVKELTDKHREDMVVLNNVEGTTLNQDKLRERLVEKGLSPDIQAFVVDVWRGRMYAELVAKEAKEKLGMDEKWAYQVAYADFLIRTCATSATLTAGDQPALFRDYALAA